MNNLDLTPRQALDVIQRLSNLDTLRLNLADHMGIQAAIKTFASIVKKQEESENLIETK